MHFHLFAMLTCVGLLIGCPADDDDDTASDDDTTPGDDDTGDDDTTPGDDDSSGDDDSAGDDDTVGDDDTTGDDDSAGDDDDSALEAGSIVGTTYWYHCDDPGNITLAPGADVSATGLGSTFVTTVSDETTAIFELVVPPDMYTVYGYWVGYEDTYTDVVVGAGDVVQQDLYFVECDQENVCDGRTYPQESDDGLDRDSECSGDCDDGDDGVYPGNGC